MIISGSLEIVVVSDSVEEGSMIVVKADLNVALNFEGSSFINVVVSVKIVAVVVDDVVAVRGGCNVDVVVVVVRACCIVGVVVTRSVAFDEGKTILSYVVEVSAVICLEMETVEFSGKSVSVSSLDASMDV